METKGNKFNNEETVVEGRNVNFKQQVEMEDNNIDEGAAVNEEKQENKSNNKMIIAGVGFMAGVAGAFGYSALRAAPAMDENIVSGKLGGSGNSNIVSNPNLEEPASLDEIQFAVTPDNDMSFNDAFASARKEVGPNGVFEWRGSVFSTYYSEEWDNLSDEYKEEFGKHNWKEEMDNLEDTGENDTDVDGADATDEEGLDITRFEIQNDEDGNEYIVLKDAITGDELHVAPDEFGLAVTDDQGEVIAFLTNDYLSEHPEPNGVIQFDGDGNCITLETMDLLDSDESEGDFVPEPLDDDVEVLNSEEEDVVVPEEFEGDYAVIDNNGEIIPEEGVEQMPEDTDMLECEDGMSDIPELDDDGMISDDPMI